MAGIARTYTAIEPRDACNWRARFSFRTELCFLERQGEEIHA